MNRREFGRISALALVGTGLQRQGWAQAVGGSGRPFGYAAIGLGTISEIFMRACAKSQQVKVTALVSGHPEKAAKYAALYGIPASSVYSYETFDRIRDNKEVDGVYVGLPNSMHKEYTVRAAEAGKHVLCEKPMAISSAECREMIAACRKANRKLLIAYRCQYNAVYLQTEKIVQSGVLGQIQSFEGAFGFNAPPRSKDPARDFWRLSKKMAGGGSLMDVGVYPLNGSRYFSREEPVSFTAVSATRDHTSGRFAEMEQTIAWTMKFPSGITASMSSSYGADMEGFLRIVGDRGALELAPAFGYTGIHLHGLTRNVHEEGTSPEVDTTDFQSEAEHLARCARTGTEPKTSGEEGLKDMVAMEAIYRAAGTPM